MEGISIQPITLDGRGFDDARVVEEAGPARRTAPAGRRRRRLSGSALVGLAATTGVIAMGLGAWAFVASERRVDATTRTASADAAVDRAVALLADPRTERLRLSGSKGRIVLAVGPGDHALLVLNGLGKAPVGRSYEAWLVRRGGKVARAAVFSGHVAVVDLAGRVPRGAAVGVTLERAGGVARPTRPLRLLARRV